jgi:dTDP-4-amino-4,6-dideoxygalactose transaminase
VQHKKINQLDLISKLNKKKIQCGVGPCPEIYREKVFKTTKSSPKNRLKKAQLLGKISIVFSINPQRTLSSVKSDINNIKNTLKNYQ